MRNFHKVIRYLSTAGVVVYRSAVNNQFSASLFPLQRYLINTDTDKETRRTKETKSGVEHKQRTGWREQTVRKSGKGSAVGFAEFQWWNFGLTWLLPVSWPAPRATSEERRSARNSGSLLFPRGRRRRLYQWPSKDTNLLDSTVGDRAVPDRENFETLCSSKPRRYFPTVGRANSCDSNRIRQPEPDTDLMESVGSRRWRRDLSVSIDKFRTLEAADG